MIDFTINNFVVIARNM